MRSDASDKTISSGHRYRAVKEYLRSGVRHVKQHVDELRLYAAAKRKDCRAKVLFFPSGWSGGGGSSSDLRAYNTAQELNERGWCCSVASARLSLNQRKRLIRYLNPDLLFIQQGVHNLNQVDLLQGRPFVFDIDDAYYLREEYTERFVALCEASKGVICSSRVIEAWCRKYQANVQVVWTGAPIGAGRLGERPSTREPILAWPHHFINGVNVEDREMFFRVACQVGQTHRLQVIVPGVQNEQGAALMKSRLHDVGVEMTSAGFLNYADFTTLLSRACVGIDLTPASEYNQAKSFGKVLAYIRAGVPCVVPRVAEYPLFFSSGINGFVASSEEEFVESIRTILSSPDLRDRIADQAWLSFVEQLSTNAAAQKVESFLVSALSR